MSAQAEGVVTPRVFIDLLRVESSFTQLFRLLVVIPLVVFTNSVKARLLSAYCHEFNFTGKAFVCLKDFSGIIVFR